MKCKLVDVFTKEKLSGNGLTIFYNYEKLDSDKMLSLAQEMRQFESIFVSNSDNNDSFNARIFTTEEELDFAGHPIIGLAAHLHEEFGDADSKEWEINLNVKSVTVVTKKTENYFYASMAQGTPEFVYTLNQAETKQVALALNLSLDNISDYPLEVISTGLPYLIVPISSSIENAKITTVDFEALLTRFGAKFVYVLDVVNFEGRTWDNKGLVEDIATGSAAGPAAAFLTKHELAFLDTSIFISQGRFLGRESKIEIYVEGVEGKASNIWVSGDVVKVADIRFV